MRTFAKVSLAILLVAVAAWASDPWKGKPYQDWNQKDIQKVLNDSPWVNMERVTATWRGTQMSMMGSATGAPNVPQRQGGMGSPGAMGGVPGSGGQPSMNGGAPGNEGVGGGGMQTEEQRAVFEARWISAKPMREALARMAMLDGKMAQPNAQRFVSQSPADYEIVVFGPDMTPFAKMNESSVAAHSVLQLGKPKGKIAPASVKFQRNPQGKLIGVTFSFPKTTGGKPTIATQEKSIELICQLKGAKLKFHFNPRKMSTKQGRNL